MYRRNLTSSSIRFLGASKLHKKKQEKNTIVGVDVIFLWPSASVCSSSNSNNVLKYLKMYIDTNGHPRKLHMDKASGFFTKKLEISLKKKQ